MTALSAGCARRALGRRRASTTAGARDGEVGPVVLADAEDVEPDLVGQLDLLDQVAQALPGPCAPDRSARRTCRCRSPSGALTLGDRRPLSGSSTTNEVAWSGSDSTQTLAAVGLDEPAHDRQPEARAAVAGGLGAGAVEGLEDPLLLGLAGCPGRGPRRASGCGRRRRARARETGWPPEWRWAFSSRFANARSSWAASARTGGRSASIETLKAPSGTSSIAAREHLLDRAPLGARLGGVGLQAREVEQVVDQAREPASPRR